jgi:hypothetical protein
MTLNTEPVDAPEKDEEVIELAVPGAEPVEPETPAEAPQDEQESPEDAPVDEQEPEGDSFPRAYVEKLRRESAEYRVKAQRADELGERLHVAMLSADGRLADPSDLPYDPAYLDDPEALSRAVGDLLARKPHLASRTPRGDIGQGASPTPEVFSLAGILRGNA